MKKEIISAKLDHSTPKYSAKASGIKQGCGSGLDPDPDSPGGHKSRIFFKSSCFEMLDVLF
jgi:hypothetical protein